MVYRMPIALVGMIFLSGCGNETRINGGGASFIYPIMLQWSRMYDQSHNVQIDYQSTGSGNGVQQTITGTIQFGCTDAFINDEQLKKAAKLGGEIIHVPLAMGGVVPIYHLPNVEGTLRFSGAVLADIYLGKIQYWDDPALQSINPNVPLPHQEIVVACRSDASGTTAIFTRYLSGVSPTWAKNVKSGTSVNWPVGVGQRGNEGVAGMVRRSPYCIGYVELIYAIQNRLSYGAVEIRDSEDKTRTNPNRPLGERIFLTASLETVTSAADATMPSVPDDLRFTLTNAPGPNSYPIAGTNWAVLYARQPTTNGSQLVEFLRWATLHGGDAQRAAESMGYAPLPRALSERIAKRLSLVTFE